MYIAKRRQFSDDYLFQGNHKLKHLIVEKCIKKKTLVITFVHSFHINQICHFSCLVKQEKIKATL